MCRHKMCHKLIDIWNWQHVGARHWVSRYSGTVCRYGLRNFTAAEPFYAAQHGDMVFSKKNGIGITLETHLNAFSLLNLSAVN